MLTHEHILGECGRRGIRLSLDPDGGIQYSAPPGMMTRRLLDALAEHKAEIAGTLAAPYPGHPGVANLSGIDRGHPDRNPASTQPGFNHTGCVSTNHKSSFNIPDIPDIPERKTVRHVAPDRTCGMMGARQEACVVPACVADTSAVGWDIRDIDVTSSPQRTSADHPIRDIPDNFPGYSPPSAWDTLASPRWSEDRHDYAPGPGIDVPADNWRWEAANWSHAKWTAWRRLAREILTFLDAPTAEEIREADRLAYAEMIKPTTAAEAAEDESGGRSGLRGRRMRHRPSGREFVCQGSHWGADNVLFIHASRGAWEPGREPRPVAPGVYRGSDVDPTAFNSPATLPASQCILIGPSPFE